MQSPRRVVVDTSAFYALVSSTDGLHTQALLSYERILDWEWETWTTSYVLVETQTLIHNRLGFGRLRAFVDAVPQIMRILWVESSIVEEAMKRMFASNDRTLSFVDWTTVVACERLRASAFSFDHMLSNAGVRVFPP